MKNAHVIGLGRSGIAAARLLHRMVGRCPERSQPVATLVDQQPQLQQEGISVLLGIVLCPIAAPTWWWLAPVYPGISRPW
jgi:UDP-N-acetylmuramoylalanine--D-glutamate ligase